MIAKKQRLDQILFNRNLAESKTKAQAMIMAGQVFVEGKPISKSGFNINHNATIEIKNLGPKWVSRGAIKLITALEKNKIVAEMIIWFIDFSRGLKNNDQLHTNRHEVVDLQSWTIHCRVISFLVLYHEAKTFYQMMTWQTQISF